MSHKLIEFAVGVGFHDNMGRHIDSHVWYFVAYNIDEAQVYFNKYVEKYIDSNVSGPMMVDYDHDWLYVRNVDQVTWEPYGESSML